LHHAFARSQITLHRDAFCKFSASTIASATPASEQRTKEDIFKKKVVASCVKSEGNCGCKLQEFGGSRKRVQREKIVLSVAERHTSRLDSLLIRCHHCLKGWLLLSSIHSWIQTAASAR
jgi:hypothetical protein